MQGSSKIVVIGIQEHKSQLQYENLPEGFQLVTVSVSRISVGAAVGGVGILLRHGSQIWPHEAAAYRNLAPSLHSKAGLTICSHIQEYNHKLGLNVLIVAGDLDVRIRLDNAKFAYHATLTEMENICMSIHRRMTLSLLILFLKHFRKFL